MARETSSDPDEALSEVAIVRWEKNYIREDEVHTLATLKMPLSRNKCIGILNKLKQPATLKKILRKKKDTFTKEGEISKKSQASLSDTEALQQYFLTNAYDERPWYSKSQVAKYINKFLLYEATVSSRRSRANSQSRADKLKAAGWVVLDKSPKNRVIKNQLEITVKNSDDQELEDL